MNKIKNENIFLKILKRIYIFPAMPLVYLYALISFYMFYKNDGAEFELIIEKDELSDHLEGSNYEHFTNTYVIPIITIFAGMCWYFIIKFFVYG